jgi:hypothetical protein
MIQCKKKFWLEHLPDLFCSLTIIPTHNMSPELQFNTLTRLVLICTLLLYIISYKYTSIFALISILLIVVVYYVQLRWNQEHFTESTPMSLNMMSAIPTYNQSGPSISLNELRNYQNQLLRGNLDVTNSDRQESTAYDMEIRESGPPLARTLVKPIVVNPPYMNMPDGYNEPTCNGVIQRKIQFKNLNEFEPEPIKESFSHPNRPTKEFFTEERNTLTPRTTLVTSYNPDSSSFSNLDNVNPYYRGEASLRGTDKMRVNEMPTSCGYNAEKKKYGYPVNYPGAPMSLNDDMTEYNKKIFTNRYGSVLYNNEIQELNYIQNLQSSPYYHGPETKVFNPKNGTSIVTRRDANSYKMPKTEMQDPFDERPSLSNIFDGRSIGYGQEYRAYIDPVASNVNYMYDDIDTGSRGYNFISRNKIDIYPEAEQTGILSEDGPNENIHRITHQGFIDRTNEFRNDMVSGYIREFDAVEAQRKLYPTQTYFGRRR